MKSRHTIIWLVIGLMFAVGVVLTLSRTDGADRLPKRDNTAVAADAVLIRNYQYAPTAIRVKAGTTVTWTNQDRVNHTVTSPDESGELNSPLFGKGESYSHTFHGPGTYEYYCKPHAHMRGTVVVE